SSSGAWRGQGAVRKPLRRWPARRQRGRRKRSGPARGAGVARGGPATRVHRSRRSRSAFADGRAIFFMLAPGEPPHGGDGAKVRVTFADGRIIEGTRDGADAKHGFFLA